MKQLLHARIFAILLLVTACTQLHAQSPQPVVRYKLVYDFCTNEYVAKMISIINLGGKIINTASQYSIIIPGNDIGNITVTAGGSANWITDVSRVVYYPTEGYTARYFQPVGSGIIAFTANTEYELFRFKYTVAGTCLPGLRLYVNGADVFDNLNDFQQYFVYTTGNPNDDFFLNNVSNLSPSCQQLDFGDLLAAWGAPKARMISPDCNGDGVPDGTGGAVWAGARIDAEAAQFFSADASGDNTNGVNDEDGFVFPAGPITAGFSYNYALTVSSNQAGKIVFYGVWFDWDDNGSFAGDVDGGGSPAFYSGSAAAGTTIQIPVNTPANPAVSFKVRVIVSDVAVTGSMSGATIANGEIEDYLAPVLLLPVTFGKMSAQARDCNVYLNFEVLTQQNASHFEIESSANGGTTWSPLATIAAKGTSSVAQSYSYIHTRPIGGMNLYRIKNVDKDGKFMYSETLGANSNCTGKGGIVSYPNPVHATLTVLLPVTTGKSQVRITDAAGKLVQNFTTQNSVNTINTQMLASGLYLLEVVNDKKIVYTSKFVKE